MMTQKHNTYLPLLHRWLRAVCSGDVNSVMSLYAPEGVLIGTFANQIKQGPQLRGYFEYFLSRKGLCGKVDSVITQPINNGVVLSGTYTFSWFESGKKQSAQARYSFVFVQRGGQWLILNHHSSAMPPVRDSEYSGLKLPEDGSTTHFIALGIIGYLIGRKLLP